MLTIKIILNLIKILLRSQQNKKIYNIYCFNLYCNSFVTFIQLVENNYNFVNLLKLCFVALTKIFFLFKNTTF